MTSIEAYKRFELKLNKLSASDSLDISPGEFVLIFNEQQVKWYKNILRDDETQALVEADFKLKQLNTQDRFVEYELPSNFLDYIRTHAYANKDNCKHRLIRPYKVPSADLEFYLRDDNNKPSFEYQEAPLIVASDKIQVYKTDFELESVFLTYYRYPLSIDLSGYMRVDGTQSTNINPELGDEQVSEILDMCVLEVQRSNENPDGFQLSNDRVNRNIND